MNIAALGVRLRNSASAGYASCRSGFLKQNGNGGNSWKDDDDFLNVDILQITTIASRIEKHFPDRWLMEMTYFLTTRLPPQLRTDEKK